MFRVIHCADIHPNSKALLGNRIAIDPATGLNQCLSDLRKSLDYMLDVAIDRDVLAILVAGDVFDSSNPDSSEIDVIVDWVTKASTAGIQLVMISGNHDISKTGASASALVSLRDRSDVTVMDRPGSTMFTPDGQMLRICGLPFPSKGFLLANEAMAGKPPEELLRVINFNLKQIIQRFDVVQDDIPTILLAHGSTINCTIGVQPRSIQGDVLIPLDECRLFDAVCLGHIHNRQQVAENAWYSGSIVRNDFGEGPEKKGFNVIEIEAGQPAKWELIENPHARRWATLTVLEAVAHMADVASEEHLQTGWRIKDTVPTEVIERTRDAVARFKKQFPYVQIDIKPVTEARVRDEFMVDMPTTHEAVQRFLDQRDPEDTGSIDSEAVMAKHTKITEEVAA